MGLNQGLNKFQRGFSRKLTKSEQARGYLFISKDKLIKKIDLQININKEFWMKKKVDSHGRIGIGRKLMTQIGNKEIIFKLHNDKLEIGY